MFHNVENNRPEKGTQAIARAAALLRQLALHPKRGERLVDLARATALEAPTAHRILQGLVGEGLVTQNQATRRYHLGPLLHELGLAAATRHAAPSAWSGILEHIARESGDTAFLTLRSGLDGVCVDRREGAYPVKAFVLEPGRRRPLGIGAGGMALLAFEARAERERVLAANATRLARDWPGYPAAMMARAASLARSRGHALHDVQELAGIRAVGVPVLLEDGRVAGAFSVSAQQSRLRGERLQMVLALLHEAAAQAVRSR